MCARLQPIIMLTVRPSCKLAFESLIYLLGTCLKPPRHEGSTCIMYKKINKRSTTPSPDGDVYVMWCKVARDNSAGISSQNLELSTCRRKQLGFLRWRGTKIGWAARATLCALVNHLIPIILKSSKNYYYQSFNVIASNTFVTPREPQSRFPSLFHFVLLAGMLPHLPYTLYNAIRVICNLGMPIEWNKYIKSEAFNFS